MDVYSSPPLPPSQLLCWELPVLYCIEVVRGSILVLLLIIKEKLKIFSSLSMTLSLWDRERLAQLEILGTSQPFSMDLHTLFLSLLPGEVLRVVHLLAFAQNCTGHSILTLLFLGAVHWKAKDVGCMLYPLFPPRIKSWAKEISLGPEQCHLVRGAYVS